MKKAIAIWTAAVAVLASAGSLAAHHSLAQFDTSKDFLKAGDVIEVCGFAMKEGVPSQSLKSSTPNVTGRIMNGHVLVMPDGEKRLWSNYGYVDCLPSDRDPRAPLTFGGGVIR